MEETHDWEIVLIWAEDDYEILHATWITAPSKPFVIFASINKGGTPPDNHTATWSVVATSNALDFAFYSVEIFMDGISLGTAQYLVEGSNIPLGGTVFFRAMDLGGEGNLSAGDTFSVYGMGESHGWVFHLIWTPDGSDVQTTMWNTP